MHSLSKLLFSVNWNCILSNIIRCLFPSYILMFKTFSAQVWLNRKQNPCWVSILKILPSSQTFNSFINCTFNSIFFARPCSFCFLESQGSGELPSYEVREKASYTFLIYTLLYLYSLSHTHLYCVALSTCLAILHWLKTSISWRINLVVKLVYTMFLGSS